MLFCICSPFLHPVAVKKYSVSCTPLPSHRVHFYFHSYLCKAIFCLYSHLPTRRLVFLSLLVIFACAVNTTGSPRPEGGDLLSPIVSTSSPDTRGGKSRRGVAGNSPPSPSPFSPSSSSTSLKPLLSTPHQLALESPTTAFYQETDSYLRGLSVPVVWECVSKRGPT